MALNVSVAHTFGVHGDNLTFNTLDFSLFFLYYLRFKFTVTISWYIKLYFTVLRTDSLFTVSISRIVGFFVLDIILFIA